MSDPFRLSILSHSREDAPDKLISLKSNSERDTLCDSIFAQRLANAPSSDTWPGESAKAVLLCLNHTAWLGSYWALVAFNDKSNTHPPVTVIVAKQKEQKGFFFVVGKQANRQES